LALLLFIKKQDYSLISTLALPPETFTLVEFVPFLVLTSTPSVPRLSLFHQVFFCRGASLVTSIVWLVVASGASSFPCKTIAKTDNRPINIDIFSFFLCFFIFRCQGTIFINRNKPLHGWF
jgi:hypothetical protein